MGPFDQGWADGTRDIGDHSPAPDEDYTQDELSEYLQGYREAQRGW